MMLVDANTRLGGAELRNMQNQVLIADGHGQPESRTSAEFRAFLLQTDLCAFNTCGEHGCGPTWAGGRHICSRIDYVLLPPAGPAYNFDMTISYEKAVMLQLPRCLRWMDHAPVICHFQYRCWFAVATQKEMAY
jgi:hypothetical protein